MKKSYILSAVAAGFLITGCAKEEPFGAGESGEGQFLKSAIAVDVKVDETVRQNARTRAAEADINEFTVVFTKAGQSQPYATYKYADMPDIVVLPVGDYNCTAYYGENRIAEWESPYFMGKSETFEVVKNEITSYIDPIECRLENIKVTIDFDPLLRSKMSADSYVEVKVGANSGLNYTTAEADAEKPGYFMHTAETTLVATFYGDIDGEKTVESKSYKNVEKGNHYKITFKLHDGGSGSATGDTDADVRVDATVTVTDVERNIEVEDEILDDSERPREEDPETPPTPPGPGEDKWSGPVATAEAPVTLPDESEWNPENGKLEITCRHTVKLSDTSTQHVVLNVKSQKGFDQFYADIVSANLTPDELDTVGLSSHLDLVEEEFNDKGESIWEILDGLGLPTNVGGTKDVKFDISTFMNLLGVFGPNEHTFVIHADDADGELVINLVLKIEN